MSDAGDAVPPRKRRLPGACKGVSAVACMILIVLTLLAAMLLSTGPGEHELSMQRRIDRGLGELPYIEDGPALAAPAGKRQGR